MDDAAQNLQVVTDHLLDLAGRQARAADQIGGSSRGVGGITHRVETTHGMACVLTSKALAAAEAARLRGGANLHKVSMELDAKLRSAKENYNNADYMAGKSLDNECRT